MNDDEIKGNLFHVNFEYVSKKLSALQWMQPQSNNERDARTLKEVLLQT